MPPWCSANMTSRAFEPASLLFLLMSAGLPPSCVGLCPDVTLTEKHSPTTYIKQAACNHSVTYRYKHFSPVGSLRTLCSLSLCSVLYIHQKRCFLWTPIFSFMWHIRKIKSAFDHSTVTKSLRTKLGEICPSSFYTRHVSPGLKSAERGMK